MLWRKFESLCLTICAWLNWIHMFISTLRLQYTVSFYAFFRGGTEELPAVWGSLNLRVVVDTGLVVNPYTTMRHSRRRMTLDSK
jgi:hypothetical protein